MPRTFSARVPGRPWLRALSGALGVLVLAGCTSAPTTPSAGPGATLPNSAAPAGVTHDAGWVTAENAKPGTPGWEVAEATYADDTELAGYFGQVSVTPGEPATLYATSTDGDYTLSAYRIGHYGGAGARRVWTSPAPVKGVKQAAAKLAADQTVTTEWTPSATVPTDGWPEGSYVVQLGAKGGTRNRYVPLTVRTPNLAGRLAMVSAVTTYQAYNAWGGYSLYKGPDGNFSTRSHHVSFDRPYDRNGAMEAFKFELPLVSQAEALGLDLGYTTSWDIDQRPGILDGARGVVSEGHDEYYSVPMRDAFEHARGTGTNLAFLGANVAYWRVRLEDGVLGKGRLMAGYKDAGADPVKGSTTTAMWRQSPAPRPENSLTGMLYECFPAAGALKVVDSSFFLFDGTGATDGGSYPDLVGTEIDRVYPIAGTPAALQVVAHSPVTCAGKWATASDAVYYTDASGAGVFSTGTMMWVNALASRTNGTGLTDASVAFSRKVTDNLLRAMAAGPMGAAHPAKPNLDSIRASASTKNGTGGAVASG
jgi:hypothetical protein